MANGIDKVNYFWVVWNYQKTKNGPCDEILPEWENIDEVWLNRKTAK